MDKNKFIKIFSEFDEFLVASLYDDINLCENINYPIYTKYFMPPGISYKLQNMKINNIKFKILGVTKDAEKNMIAIYPEDMEDFISFPVKYFKIKNKSKFHKLLHKDYLGSIMGLGIKRELLGDLIVNDNICYGIISEENFENLVNNLNTVGRNPVEITEAFQDEIPNISYEDMIITLPSLRLDSVVSELIQISRNKATDLINSQEINVNYKIEKNKSKILEVNDIITIHKKGKFKIYENLGENKKGKLKILIKKFN